jgi:hypothetical protein
MKKCMIGGLAAAMVLTVAWAAWAQPQAGGAGAGQGPGGGGRGMGGRGGFVNREDQLKAIAALQEQAAKLKALVESMPAMPAGGFQDMTEEQRTKMRDTMQKIGEERPPIMAAIEKQVAVLKGARTLVTEFQQSSAELKALQELATKEKATETAKKIGDMIAAKQKKLEEDTKAMGVEPDRLQRMLEGRGGPGGGQRQGGGGN